MFTLLLCLCQNPADDDPLRPDSTSPPHTGGGAIHNKRDLGRSDEELEYPSRQFPKGHETVFRMLIHPMKVGAVIGKGGDRVKQMREETGARVKVAMGVPDCNERVVIIWSLVGGWMDGWMDESVGLHGEKECSVVS